MKIEIKSRWSGSVLFSLETETLKLALEAGVKEGANLEGANLEGANLEGAYLKGANLEGANLEGAYLEGAYLEGAYLKGANLEGAYLKGAYLEGAYLEGAYLVGAYLKGAYLEGANLEGAYLVGAKEDFFKVLDSSPNEVAGLRDKIVAGRINGSVYEGDCACLVGTIANIAGCKYNALPNLKPNGNRPAEKWFMMFRPGHTPESHGGMKITLGWLDEWMNKNKTPVTSDGR